MGPRAQANAPVLGARTENRCILCLTNDSESGTKGDPFEKQVCGGEGLPLTTPNEKLAAITTAHNQYKGLCCRRTKKDTRDGVVTIVVSLDLEERRLRRSGLYV